MTRRPLSALLVLAALAAGCPRSEAPAPAPSAPSAPAPGPASAPSAPSAEGLPLVRGVVVLSAEAPRLTPCGSAEALTLRDETGTALAEAYGQLASEQTGEMWVEVRGTSDATGVTARELVRALPLGESDPCTSLLPAGHLRALGNEPFWSVTVTPDGLAFEEPGQAEPLRFPASAPEANGARRTWKAEIAGTPAHRLELVVGPARCRDGMSGAWYGLAAEAVLDGRAFTGCAVAGE